MDKIGASLSKELKAELFNVFQHLMLVMLGGIPASAGLTGMMRKAADEIDVHLTNQQKEQEAFNEQSS
jgi:hypothetical protein